jgi:hypothetical protein
MNQAFFRIPLLVLLLMEAPGQLPAQMLSPAQLAEDYDIFCRALREAHPGLYRFMPAQEMDQRMRETGDRLVDPMSAVQFYRLLAPVVAGIGCGHTKFHPAGALTEERLYHHFFDTLGLFPLRLLFGDGRARVTGTYREGDSPIAFGSELLAINGRPADSLTAVLFDRIAADGRVQSARYAELDDFFPAYYANLIGNAAVFELVYRSPDGAVRTAELPGVSLSEIRRWRDRQSDAAEPNYRLSYPASGVALMRIRAFYPLDPKDNFKKFLQSAFREIGERRTEHLIIDLRGNEGGMDRWGARLYARLADSSFLYYRSLEINRKTHSIAPYARYPRHYGLMKMLVSEKDGRYYWKHHSNLRRQKPDRNPYAGKVYILTDGRSYSVAAEFCAVARSQGRAVFIGEECGGAYSGNNSGTFLIVTLPHSRLELGIPLLGYYMQVAPVNPPDRGVLPDYEIHPTPESIRGGRDAVLEYALELIAGGK